MTSSSRPDQLFKYQHFDRRHAQWALDHENDLRSLAAARRFALAGFNLLGDPDSADSRLLMDDQPPGSGLRNARQGLSSVLLMAAYGHKRSLR